MIPTDNNVAPVRGQVELPEMIGRNAKDVQDELRYLGLTDVELSSANPKYSAVLVAANWTVVRVDPPAGTAVQTGRHIVVSVTKS